MKSFNRYIENFNSWFENRSRITFTVILVSLMFLFTLIFHFFLDVIRIRDLTIVNNLVEEKNPVILFVSTVILAPVVETYLCQSLPYKLLRKIKYFSKRDFSILITSALIFGLLHFYSLLYIIYAIFIGFILMYGYMIRVKSDKNVFLLIVISHSVFNLGIFIINIL